MNENLFWDTLETVNDVLEGPCSFGEVQRAISAVEPAMVWAHCRGLGPQLVVLREFYRILVLLREARCRDLH